MSLIPPTQLSPILPETTTETPTLPPQTSLIPSTQSSVIPSSTAPETSTPQTKVSPIPSKDTSPAPSPTTTLTTTPPTQQYPWETYKTIIKYDNPQLYLIPGTQSSLNEKYTEEIKAKIGIINNNIDGLATIFRWKQNNFRSYAAGGQYIGKITVNEIMEKRELSGCHDHALIMASVFRKYGFPAIMVDTAGIQWAINYSKGIQTGLSGHVFVEVYVNNKWILVDTTSGEYIENYDYYNSVIPITKSIENTGYYVLLKGIDPEGYGVTSLEQLAKYMTTFTIRVDIIEMYFPKYEIKIFH